MKRILTLSALAILFNHCYSQASRFEYVPVPNASMSSLTERWGDSANYISYHSYNDTLFTMTSYVVAYDLNGNCLWKKLICPDGSCNSNDYAIADWQVSQNNIYLAMMSSSTYDIKIIKLNSAGSVMWTKTASVDTSANYFQNLISYDQGVILHYVSSDGSSYDHEYVKLDVNGDMVWDRNCNVPDPKCPIDKGAVDDNGNLTVVGSALHSMITIQLDAAGNLLNGRKYNNDDVNDYMNIMEVGLFDNGKSVVTGIRYMSPSFLYNLFFAVSDINGNLTELKVRDDLVDFGALVGISMTEANTAILGFLGYDTVTFEAFVEIIEINEMGNILMAKRCMSNSFGTANMVARLGHTDFYFLNAMADSLFLLTSADEMNSCKEFVDFTPVISTVDVSELLITTPVTVSNGAIQVQTGTTTTTQNEPLVPLSLLCFSGTGIEEPEFSFQIYPNPVAEILQIQSESIIDKVQLSSLDGKIIREMKGTPGDITTIDVGSFSPGIYFISLYANGEVSTKKFIKN